MKILPEQVSKAWDNRIGPSIFTTVDKNKIPNSIYVKAISKYNDNTFIIADNYFNKTRKNIMQGSEGAILFMVSEKEAYQIKGTISYYTEGVYYEDMKKWNNPKHPRRAVAVVEVKEVYKGAEKIL